MTWEEVRAVAMALPDVQEGMAYGFPALKVKGKLLTRLRPEDQSLVLCDVGFDERDMLLEADPETFHLTPHYQGYPCILARLEALDARTLRFFLERRWRRAAPKATVKAYDKAALPS